MSDHKDYKLNIDRFIDINSHLTQHEIFIMFWEPYIHSRSHYSGILTKISHDLTCNHYQVFLNQHNNRVYILHTRRNLKRLILYMVRVTA